MSKKKSPDERRVTRIGVVSAVALASIFGGSSAVADDRGHSPVERLLLKSKPVERLLLKSKPVERVLQKLNPSDVLQKLPPVLRRRPPRG